MNPQSPEVTDGGSITFSNKENKIKVGSDIWALRPSFRANTLGWKFNYKTGKAVNICMRIKQDSSFKEENVLKSQDTSGFSWLKFQRKTKQRALEMFHSFEKGRIIVSWYLKRVCLHSTNGYIYSKSEELITCRGIFPPAISRSVFFISFASGNLGNLSKKESHVSNKK